MILCDTNILIEVYRGNADIVASLKHIGLDNVAVSDVTCAELLFGARNKIELHTICKDLNKLVVFPIIAEISTMAVSLVEKYALSHKMNLPDALIAATAIYQDVELYTLNMKDFVYIPKVKLYTRS